jgi:hypothetical protein
VTLPPVLAGQVGGFTLEPADPAISEGYTVLADGLPVALLRLRNGRFRAEVEGEVVYTASPDTLTGGGWFASPQERERHLRQGLAAIEKTLKQKERNER